jgi:PilZ domain
MSASGGNGGVQRRRAQRLVGRFPVEVREKLATWSTSTEDVSPRGCRIGLRRALTPGALVQLAFDMGPGAEPLVVHAQVAWVRRSPPEVAGVTFLSAPRLGSRAESSSGAWIDTLLSARIRLLADEAGPERPPRGADDGAAIDPAA